MKTTLNLAKNAKLNSIRNGMRHKGFTQSNQQAISTNKTQANLKLPSAMPERVLEVLLCIPIIERLIYKIKTSNTFLELKRSQFTCKDLKKLNK